jgi:hypothetical protein
MGLRAMTLLGSALPCRLNLHVILIKRVFPHFLPVLCGKTPFKGAGDRTLAREPPSVF